jgi:hypothetical protein
MPILLRTCAYGCAVQGFGPTHADHHIIQRQFPGFIHHRLIPSFALKVVQQADLSRLWQSRQAKNTYKRGKTSASKPSTKKGSHQTIRAQQSTSQPSATYTTKPGAEQKKQKACKQNFPRDWLNQALSLSFPQEMGHSEKQTASQRTFGRHCCKD